MNTKIYKNITIGDLLNHLEKNEVEFKKVYGCMEFDSNQTRYESKSGKFQIGVSASSYENASVISYLLRCIFDKFDFKKRLDDIIELQIDSRVCDEMDENTTKEEMNKLIEKEKEKIETVDDIIKIIAENEENSFVEIDQELLDINKIKKSLKKILFKMHKYNVQEMKDYFA